jgi:prepilin-type N-terminal cleavage/methylation domain-containing protein
MIWRRKLNSNGFTLAELLIALGILSVLMTLAAPAVRRTSEAVQLKASARQLHGLLRYVREQAVLLSQTHAVIIDEPTQKYWVVSENGGWDTPRVLRRTPGIDGQLGPNMRFHKISVGGERTKASQPAIYFDAEGNATAAEIVLAVAESKPFCHVTVNSVGNIEIRVED